MGRSAFEPSRVGAAARAVDVAGDARLVLQSKRHDRPARVDMLVTCFHAAPARRLNAVKTRQPGDEFGFQTWDSG